MTQCIYLRFLYAKNRCAQGFQSLPHAGNKRFRKCGEKPRSVDQTAVLHLCPAVLLVKIGLRSEVSGFPVLPKTAIKTHCPKAKTRQIPFGNSLLNAKTAFRRFPRTKPDVPSQGLFTVGTLRKSPIPVNPLPRNPSELKPSSIASVKLHASKKTPAIPPFPN